MIFCIFIIFGWLLYLSFGTGIRAYLEFLVERIQDLEISDGANEHALDIHESNASFPESKISWQKHDIRNDDGYETFYSVRFKRGGFRDPELTPIRTIALHRFRSVKFTDDEIYETPSPFLS